MSAGPRSRDHRGFAPRRLSRKKLFIVRPVATALAPEAVAVGTCSVRNVPHGLSRTWRVVSAAKSCPKPQRFLSNESDGTTVGHGLIVMASHPFSIDGNFLD